MAIKLSPEELINQAEQMRSLRNQYDALFSSVLSNLNQVNRNWSENLSNNFAGKIVSAQKSFSTIIDVLDFGADSAIQSANTFTDIDRLLSNGIDGVSETVNDAMKEIKKDFTEHNGEDYDLWGKVLDILGVGTGPVGPASDFLNVFYDLYKDIKDGEYKGSGLLANVGEHFLKGAGKLVDISKELSKTKAGVLGRISGIFKVGSGIAGLFKDSSIDNYVDSSCDIVDGGVAIFGKATPLIAAEINGIYAGISHTVGDIIKFSTDDHPITGDEVGEIFGDMGLNMGNGLVKGLTLGAVDIDVDRAKEIIIARRTDWENQVADTGLPLAAQVPIAAIGSCGIPAVAAVEYAAEKCGALYEATNKLNDTISDAILGLFN